MERDVPLWSFAEVTDTSDYPAVAAEAWTEFLDGPAEEVRRNAERVPGPYNRVVGWVAPVVTRKAGSPPG